MNKLSFLLFVLLLILAQQYNNKPGAWGIRDWKFYKNLEIELAVFRLQIITPALNFRI